MAEKEANARYQVRQEAAETDGYWMARCCGAGFKLSGLISPICSTVIVGQLLARGWQLWLSAFPGALSAAKGGAIYDVLQIHHLCVSLHARHNPPRQHRLSQHVSAS